MGLPMQQLAQQMTAQEFGLHLLLEQIGQRETWPDPDAPAAGADADAHPVTVDQIMASARMAGMTQ